MPFETVSLAAVVEDALDLVRPACSHAGVELIYSKPDAAISVLGDPHALHQLTINLVLNAAEAAAGQKDRPAKIAVDLARLGEDRAALHVRDSGPGPPKTWPNDCSNPSCPENLPARAWDYSLPDRLPKTITGR